LCRQARAQVRLRRRIEPGAAGLPVADRERDDGGDGPVDAAGARRMRSVLLAAGLIASPALAQDHSGHGATDHAAMDHGAREYAEADHSRMDHAAMEHAAPDAPVEASGSARLPAAEGMMPGVHFGLGGGWSGMAHGFLWGVHTEQTGQRGDDRTYVQSMAMLMAEKDFGGARLQLKTMLSAEPLMRNTGYPNLFATGETADGAALVDRQHPHDLFMELAARVDVEVAEGTTVFLYGGPVGE